MGETYVTSTAMIQCTFGTNPCPLMASPGRMTKLSNLAKLNIMDFTPMTCIGSFGMCSSPSNPAVIAATAAALGVFTPAPCVPAVTTPWMPGAATFMVEGMPALTNQCKNMCMWAGQISFSNDGQIPIPPPVTTPPLGNPSLAPTGDRAPLTEEETAKLSPSDRQQYQEESAYAQKAGDNEMKMGEAWKKTSDDYTKKGEPEKAAMAKKKSDDSLSAGIDKRNTAVGDVNEKFRKKIVN